MEDENRILSVDSDVEEGEIEGIEEMELEKDEKEEMFEELDENKQKRLKHILEKMERVGLEGLYKSEVMELSKTEGLRVWGNVRLKMKDELIRDLREKMAWPERTEEQIENERKEKERKRKKRTERRNQVFNDRRKRIIRAKIEKVGLEGLHLDEVWELARAEEIVAWPSKSKDELVSELRSKLAIPPRAKEQIKGGNKVRKQQKRWRRKPLSTEEHKMARELLAEISKVGLEGLVKPELDLLARKDGLGFYNSKEELIEDLREKMRLPLTSQEQMENGKRHRERKRLDFSAKTESKLEEVHAKKEKVGLDGLFISELQLLAREEGVVYKSESRRIGRKWIYRTREIWFRTSNASIL